MKLASLGAGGPDGTLVVVSRDLGRAVPVPEIAATLQQALDRWAKAAPLLEAVSRAIDKPASRRGKRFEAARLAAPLPRAYQWLDGSAYLNHSELVRRARGAAMPSNFATEPLMYQGGSDGFLGPRDPIVCESEDWGIDFEAEIAVVTDTVPMGMPASEVGHHIKLFMLANDVSLRRLIPGEIAKGLGFIHAKPATAFAPVAVTADELGTAWDGARLHLPIFSHLNDVLFGRPDAGVDMAFGFPALVAHAARTRRLAAGTIIGSGTVSNRDRNVGASCIAEKRTIETLEEGKAKTPYLRFGDRVRIEMFGADGVSVFGAIDHQVAPYRRPGVEGVAARRKKCR